MELDKMIENIKAGKSFFFPVNTSIGVENSVPRLIENRLNLELMLLHISRLKSHVDSIYGLNNPNGDYELYYRIKVAE